MTEIDVSEVAEDYQHDPHRHSRANAYDYRTGFAAAAALAVGASHLQRSVATKMKQILVPILFGLAGCVLFYFRRPVGLAAERIGFPLFFRGDQNARIRLFGTIGIVFALISLGMAALIWLANQ